MMATALAMNLIPVSKATHTKRRIIEKAAIVFNQYGYAGSSINQIMQLTGLQKGGIYNHFKSKDEIALAAFDYTIELLHQTVMTEMLPKDHAIDRLHALIEGFKRFSKHPNIVGGCPILNTATESDDTHPALRQRTQEAVNQIRALIGSIVELGIRQKEIIADADGEEVSLVIISTIEGGMMLSKLYGNYGYLDRAAKHLHHYIDTHGYLTTSSMNYRSRTVDFDTER
jgi:TetR/AcrR family transcriptional regulator, transcriptional repressor for nem operon